MPGVLTGLVAGLGRGLASPFEGAARAGRRRRDRNALRKDGRALLHRKVGPKGRKVGKRTRKRLRKRLRP